MPTDKSVASTRSRSEPYFLRWDISSAKDRRIQVRRDFYPPDHRYPLHEHDWSELLIVEHGELIHAGPDWRQVLKRGSIALVPMSCQHELISPKHASCVLVNLAVHQEFVSALQLLQEDPLLSILSGSGNPQTITLGSFDLVLCARMITEAMASKDHRLALSLLLFLLDRSSRQGSAQGMPEALAMALARLHEPEHLREGIPFLSRYSGYNADHCCRLIKQHHGCTAIELVTQLRLDHLADRVLHGDTHIADICAECGIANRTHANRRFKERYGCTPSELRRQR